MYKGNYYPDGDELKIPERYGGSAFREETIEGDEQSEETAAETSSGYKEAVSRSVFPFFENIPFIGSFFKGEAGIGKWLGTEEILILGIALILFLNHESDKELLVMLIALLFIK